MPFVPLKADSDIQAPAWRFVPLDAEPKAAGHFIPIDQKAHDQPAAIDPASVARNVLLNNPATAVAETGANLASQTVALPVAGLAGLATEAGHALGLTDKRGAEVVHDVAGVMTYQPRGEMGQAATDVATYPFQKLAEAGQAVGNKVLETTGSPLAATAADTAINALPMLVAPAVKGARTIGERIAAPKNGEPMPVSQGTTMAVTSEVPPPSAEQRVATFEPVSRQPEFGVAIGALSRARTIDEAIAAANAVVEAPVDVPAQKAAAMPPPVAETTAPMAQVPPRTEAIAAPVEALPVTPIAGMAGPLTLQRNATGNLIVSGAAVDLRIMEGYLRDGMRQHGINLTKIIDHADGGALRVPRTAEDATVVALIGELNQQALASGWKPRRGNRSQPEAQLRPAPQETLETPVSTEGMVVDHVTLGHPKFADELQGRFVSAEGSQSGSKSIALSPAEASMPKAAEVIPPGTTAPVVGRFVPREDKPLAERIDTAAHEAATSPLNDKPQPTQAQIESGTYAKGHVDLQGIGISIENPKGSIRRGKDADGQPWATEMQHHYGYIKRTLAKDGDHVDVFIGERPESTKAFVVDQIDPKTGKYDEPKVILGATDTADASRIYHANYEPGWKGGGAITEMPVEQFKVWLKTGDTKRPVGLKKIIGKYVTEYPEAALKRFAASSSKVAGELAQAELDRRAASAEFSTAVRAQLGEPNDVQAMANAVQNGTWNPGANYAPFVDQMRTPESQAASVSDLPAPIRREAIIKDFADALGATVYEGRVKGKRLGFFRQKNEEVRIKNAADIEVTAHELAHLIDSREPKLAEAWRADKGLREELKSVSYDQRNVREGFAEGLRLWMTQPETLEAKAPKVFAWLNGFADSHEYGQAMRKAQERMTAWFGQDALNRARSKIGSDQPLTEYFDRFWDKFRQSTTDDLHGIYTMERSLTGKINPAGPYESARLARASASIADGAVRFGVPVKKPDGAFGWKGKGLEEILQPVAERLDDTLLYFVGRSANELMGQGREHLFTRGEIDAMLRLKTPERAKAFEEYQAWNRGILDFAEAQGVINPESRRLWQRTQYLPFHRVEQPGGLKGKPGDWQGIQALTGGTTNIKDVLGNMIGNAAMLLDKAVKNEARLKVADLADKAEGAGKWMVKIEPGERPVKIGGDQVLEAMFKRYGIAVDGDAPTFFRFMLRGQPPAGNNVVAVLRNGKPEWYEVGDPILYRALAAIDRPAQNWLVRMLGVPKRIGQASITLTPDFWVANIARDTLMGSVMSRAGFKPIMDSLDGMRLRITNDPLYKDYIANGGGLSSIYLDEHHFRAKLEKFYRRQGIDYRTVLDTPDKLLSFIETLGDAFEMSTRLGEYERAIARGEHPRHAAYLGREVSTDFAMRGDSKALGFMYDTVMFLRPAVVSMDRLFRGVAHDPNKGAIMAKTAALAGLSVALYLHNRNDSRYADLQDWDRDANWHFLIGDQHYRWPKIWEIGAVASVAERTTEKLMQDDPQGLGKDFARIVGQVFNLNLMPQIIAPLAEQAMNRNSLTTAPIETPGMENVQPFLRAKPGTSETMKALGMATHDNPEWAQVNPVRAEALLRGYLNTWGLYGLMLTDKAFFSDKLPEKRADELPIVRRFYESEPPKHTKYESQFYDMLNEAQRLRGTMKALDAMNRSDLADEKEKSPLAGEAKPLERAAKSLGAINKDMEQVRRDPVLSPEEKRRKLDELTIERNALLKAAVQDSQAARKEKTQ